jgi:two-component system, chemotaxis family, response regulator Rcp1
VTEIGEFQILLIDDLVSDAKLFEHALQQAETRVKMYWVASVEEGLEYLKQEGRFASAGRVRLVVSDLSMPGMDGFQLLAQMRQNSALSALPVVIMSSSRAPRDVLRCYQLGANSYIMKPMSLETFVTTVRTVVQYWLDIVELPDASLVD